MRWRWQCNGWHACGHGQLIWERGEGHYHVYMIDICTSRGIASPLSPLVTWLMTWPKTWLSALHGKRRPPARHRNSLTLFIVQTLYSVNLFATSLIHTAVGETTETLLSTTTDYPVRILSLNENQTRRACFGRSLSVFALHVGAVNTWTAFWPKSREDFAIIMMNRLKTEVVFT